MPTILVTGSNGQVGQELQAISKQFPDFEFIWTDVAELDITDKTAVQDLFQQYTFEYCLNCAAYTAVDKAESQEELARQINVTGPKNLAEAAAATNCKIIQLSTDYVYHGQQNTPYKEGDPVSPQGVYAKTKLAGDEAVLEKNSQNLVIRTSWVYSSFGQNFVKTMRRLGSEKEELRVIYDQIGSPTYARDLAMAMLQIIQQLAKEKVDQQSASGVFHYSNEGVTSWYDFALAIFEISGITCKVYPIETSEYPTAAARPPFSLLHKGKIKAVFQLEIPHWRESLNRCIQLL